MDTPRAFDEHRVICNVIHNVDDNCLLTAAEMTWMH